MASKFLEGLASAVLPVLQGLESQYVFELLEKIHARDAEKHRKILLDGNMWLADLLLEAEKTKTKFDDAAVNGLINGINLSAEAHDIELPE